MRRSSLIGLATLLALATFGPGRAEADLIITVGDATIGAGGTGSVDVFISSTSGDALALTAFKFAITPPSPSSELAFANPQSDSELAQANYVFAGNSYDQTSGQAVGGVSSDLFSGGDNTVPLSDPTSNLAPEVTLTTTPLLLVTLDFTTRTSSPPQIGDSFVISLVPDGSTMFTDASFNPIAFTSTSGTVTIQGSAVPEPGSLILIALGGSVASFRGMRTRRRSL